MSHASEKLSLARDKHLLFLSSLRRVSNVPLEIAKSNCYTRPIVGRGLLLEEDGRKHAGCHEQRFSNLSVGSEAVTQRPNQRTPSKPSAILFITSGWASNDLKGKPEIAATWTLLRTTTHTQTQTLNRQTTFNYTIVSTLIKSYRIFSPSHLVQIFSPLVITTGRRSAICGASFPR